MDDDPDPNPFDPFPEFFELELFPPPLASTERANWEKFKRKRMRQDLGEYMRGERWSDGENELLRRFWTGV